jgi:hypothetical protein
MKPYSDQPEREDYLDKLKKLIGKITLTKEKFLGLQLDKIEIYITPSLKIIRINTKPEKLRGSVGLSEKSTLDTQKLKEWADEHGYQVSFVAQLPKLKRHLFNIFGDVLQTDDTLSESYGKRKIEIIIKEEELPESIKEWAYNNPEKFLQNLQRIRDILKD